MYNFSTQISKFHERHVRLSNIQRKDMKDWCNSNLERIKKGLKTLQYPAINKTKFLGAYAQKTMIKPPEADQENSSPIDLGIVFDQDDAREPRATRQWIDAAISCTVTNRSERLTASDKWIEVKSGGRFQCRFFVFRRRRTDASWRYELASGEEWVADDIAAMSQWIEREVPSKSPESSGGYQLRRIIRLGKFYAKTHGARLNRSFPSGLIVTALFIECYVASGGRDDKSFKETLCKLSLRPKNTPVYANGVQVSDDKDIQCIGSLIDVAKESVQELEKLGANDITDSDSKSIWNAVFRHSFFEDDTEVLDDEEIIDAPHAKYNVSSYGWDSDVEGLVKRLERSDIYVPRFQRGFVWTGPEKSRFIETLILGLPVPNVFLAQDSKTKNLNIVDGQQRLRSLWDYLEGKFYLTGKDIKEELQGCYFSREVAKTTSSKVLSNIDARALADAVLHSIVIKPDPSYDDPRLGHEYNQAIIQIFKRLNTSGKPLQAHEIRASIFYGPLDNMLRELNENETWRELFGKAHPRLKDMELILRVIALRENYDDYRSPMRNFLDTFMEENRDIAASKISELKAVFAKCVNLIRPAFGKESLRPGRTLTASRFDAVMIGVDAYLSRHPDPEPTDVFDRLKKLEQDSDYIWSIERSTSETERVKMRISRAKEIFGS